MPWKSMAWIDAPDHGLAGFKRYVAPIGSRPQYTAHWCDTD